MFVKDVLKYIPADELIIDVNSYDFSRPPLFSYNTQPNWTSRYNKEFHTLNPSTNALKKLATKAAPVVKRFADLCRDPLEETLFYQNYMKPQRHRYSLVGCLPLLAGGQAPNFQLLLVRYDGAQDFSDLDIACLTLLLPSMAQSVQRIMKDSHTWTISILRNAFDLPPKLSEVAALVVQGFSNKEIAEQLGITAGTTKHYVHQIFELTGTSTRADLCRIVLG